MDDWTTFLVSWLVICCAVELKTTKGVQECASSGFPSASDIININLEQNAASFEFKEDNSSNTTRIIPKLKVTCNGILRSMIFARDMRGSNFLARPLLQTWRRVPDTDNEFTNDSYRLIHSDIWCLSVMRVNQDVINCTLESSDGSLDVRDGDIFGIQLPPTNESRVGFYFANESTSNLSISTNYVFNTQQIDNEIIILDENIKTDQALPLVYFDIKPAGNGEDSNLNRRTLEQIFIAVVVLVLLFIIIMLIVAIIINRTRNKKKERESERKKTTQVFTNQNYESDTIIASPSVCESREYASVDDDIGTSYPAISVHTTETDNHHASPQEGLPDKKASLVSSYSHYEQSYVPYGEERIVVSAQCNHTVTREGKETTVSIEPSPVFFEECDSFWNPSSNPEELYEQLHAKKYREILTSQLQILNDEQLGIGNFGTVHKGIWQSPMGAMDVAVKTLRSGAKEEEKIKFLQEAAINGQFRHPNVVQLMGVVTVEEPVMIILELLPNGDLHNYLINQRPISTDGSSLQNSIVPTALLKFCQQIASGMEYLSKKGFVHRDLAARNILVAQDKICKISDFGMCRDLMDDNYYVSHGGQVPVKWTAPEAIYYKKYSTASDVWSFGCVMYEIWSLGHKPFETHSNREVPKMIEKGYRLPPPMGCSREIYRIMIQCWHPKTDCRPSFDTLLEMLCKPEYELFMWKDNEDSESKVVGAPLELGKNLYPTLQTAYLDN